MYTTTKLRVYDLNLARMFKPGGETFNWFDRNVRRPMITKARRDTPVRRHGALLRGMRSRTFGTNQYAVRIYMWNDVHYAAIVHEGHRGGYVQGRPWLWVGVQSDWPERGSRGKARLEWVSAQFGNPWMERAKDWALHRKGLI